jgi:hypothetical protein
VKVPELLSTTSRDKATKGDCAKIDKLSINEKKKCETFSNNIIHTKKIYC